MTAYLMTTVPDEIFRYSLKNLESQLNANIVVGKLKVDEKEQLLQMDENSFKKFYEETYKKVWRFIFQLCGSYDLTNDVIQDSYIKFLQKVSQEFNFVQKKVFLYKIANNILKDYFRKKAIEKRCINNGDLDKSGIINRELKMDMEKFLSQMGIKERELLMLAYVEGYKHEEISEITGDKISSVKVMLFRARKKLLSIIKENN